MGRKSSFGSVVTKIAREAARAERQAEQARARQLREAERVRMQTERALAQAAKEDQRQAATDLKEAQQRYFLARQQEADAANIELAELVDELCHILEHTLKVNDAISLDSLRVAADIPPFVPPSELTTPIGEPDYADFVRDIKKPSGLSGMFPSKKNAYQADLEAAERRYAEVKQQRVEREEQRQQQLTALRAEYDNRVAALKAKAERTNLDVAVFQKSLAAGEPEAIVAYNAMVLERSVYPTGCPQEFRLAYVPESRELVVEYELPGLSIVPATLEYRYNKTKDVLDEKPRKASEIKDIYQNVVAGIALRTIHEIFEADTDQRILVVAFNGFVATVNPATGRDIRPCLISVRTTRERFGELDLKRVDKHICLRNLGAQVSPRPAEMQPVKPIIEFSMVDRRFVEASDVLADLESRPNLMELSPFEFENLVSNLFGKMGLETRLTRASRDGGVDCVAYDTRPILGGKVVIQAKRYSHTVGVSAVRDLYGTMMNEGANKGILVSTSGYGPDAYEFQKDKPIELIDGGGLLYLLEQNGVQARIVFLEQGK